MCIQCALVHIATYTCIIPELYCVYSLLTGYSVLGKDAEGPRVEIGYLRATLCATLPGGDGKQE